MLKWTSWLSLIAAVFALLAILFGPVFYSIFGDFSELVQVYGGMGFGIVAAVLGIVGAATYSIRPVGLTVLSGLSALVGLSVIGLTVVAYMMEWLSPRFY